MKTTIALFASTLAIAGSLCAQRSNLDMPPIAAWDFEATLPVDITGETQAKAAGYVWSNGMEKVIVARVGEQSGSNRPGAAATLDASAFIFPGDPLADGITMGDFGANQLAGTTGGSTVSSIYLLGYGLESSLAESNDQYALGGDVSGKELVITLNTLGWYATQLAIDLKALLPAFTVAPTITVTAMGETTTLPTSALTNSFQTFVYDLPIAADNASTVVIRISTSASSMGSQDFGNGVYQDTERGLGVDNVIVRGVKLAPGTPTESGILYNTYHHDLFFNAVAEADGYVSIGGADIFVSNFPYIWEPTMGYFYVQEQTISSTQAASSNTNQAWLWSYATLGGTAAGWTWIDFDYFPWVYSTSLGWLYIHSGDSQWAGQVWSHDQQTLLSNAQ